MQYSDHVATARLSAPNRHHLRYTQCGVLQINYQIQTGLCGKSTSTASALDTTRSKLYIHIATIMAFNENKFGLLRNGPNKND